MKEMLMFAQSKKIPILKNGNRMGLQFLKLKNTKLTVNNTCAFDSLYQILLAVASDHTKFQEYVETNCDNNYLFALIRYTMAMRKVTSKTYLLRAEAIVNALDIVLVSESIQQIDAVCNVAKLYEKLFENQPGIIKQSQCCKKTTNKCIVSLGDKIMFDDNVEHLPISIVTETGRTCPGCNKWKNVLWKPLQIGMTKLSEDSRC